MIFRVLLAILIALCVVSNACQVEELEKKFPYLASDVGFGFIFLEYKTNVTMLDDGEKVNWTYFIVDLHLFKPQPEAKLGEKLTLEDIADKAELWPKLDRGLIDIQFYDKNGNALVAPLSEGFRLAGYESSVYETNIKRGENGWILQWKGILPEMLLTFENFCDIDSVQAREIKR